MTKYIPILFSTEMVEAILAGRKTQTRRDKGLDLVNLSYSDHFKYLGKNHQIQKFHLFGWENDIGFLEKGLITCPYGKTGDVLWVRETWTYSDEIDNPYWYKQQFEEEYLPEHQLKGIWKPSIHMPKEACRLFLRITNIRCERLQEISEVDSRAEGIKPLFPYYMDYTGNLSHVLTAYASFKTLWQKINGEDSWNENPWVWVIEFEKIDKPANWPQ